MDIGLARELIRSPLHEISDTAPMAWVAASRSSLCSLGLAEAFQEGPLGLEGPSICEGPNMEVRGLIARNG